MEHVHKWLATGVNNQWACDCGALLRADTSRMDYAAGFRDGAAAMRDAAAKAFAKTHPAVAFGISVLPIPESEPPK